MGGGGGLWTGSGEGGRGWGRTAAAVARPSATTAVGGPPPQGKNPPPQGQSGGSVGTTDQGNGKGRSGERLMGTTAYGGKGQGKGKGSREGRLELGGRGRSKGGERPMGTTADGGKGSRGRAANGDRPVGAASCRREQHTMVSEVVRSSVGAGVVYPPPFWGVIRVAYPKA